MIWLILVVGCLFCVAVLCWLVDSGVCLDLHFAGWLL